MNSFLVTPIVTNCNCNNDYITNQLNTIETNLVSIGNKLFLSQSYEIGNSPNNLEMFNLISQKDIIDSELNKLCKLSTTYLHTEDTYLEKYCHEDEV